MKRLLFSLFIVLLSIPTFSQVNIDSMINILNFSKQDTNKVIILNKISNYYYETQNFDTSINYANQAMQLAEKLFFLKGVVISKKIKSANYLYKNDLENTLNNILEAKAICKNINEKELVIDIYLYLANYYILIDKITEVEKLKTDFIYLAESKNNYLQIPEFYDKVGKSLGTFQKYDKAIEFFNEGMEYCLTNDLEEQYIDLLISNSRLYNEIGSYEKALTQLLQGLEYSKLNKIDRKTFRILNFIGMIYSSFDDHKKAVEYFMQALEVAKQINDLELISLIYNNLGDGNKNLKNYDIALEYLYKALKISNDKKDSLMLYYNEITISEILLAMGEYNEALEYSMDILKWAEYQTDFETVVYTYNVVGEIYLQLNDLKKAENYLNKAIKIIDSGLTDKSLDLYKNLATLYTKKSDFKTALHFYETYVNIKDSTFSTENFSKLNSINTNFEIDKREKINLELEKENKINVLEADKQRLIRNIFIAAFLIMILFTVIFIYMFLKLKNNNRILHLQKTKISEKNQLLEIQKEEIMTQNNILMQQKEEILSQKDEIQMQNYRIKIQNHELERKRKDLTDSIKYAKKIQEAMLPDFEILNTKFADNFIFFKPRDIVSGDFYWTEIVDNKIIVVVADCTGHGVPGALMSMLSMTLLNEIIFYEKTVEPAEILEELRQQVKKLLKQTGKSGENQDGLDVSICVFENQNSEMTYAGANNPIYLIRNNEIIQYKPNRQPIAIYLKEREFFQHKIELQKNDLIYMFTDGYFDQFGGEIGEKLKTAVFKEYLLESCNETFENQLINLKNKLATWQGKNYDQIDDILVLGLKI